MQLHRVDLRDLEVERKVNLAGVVKAVEEVKTLVDEVRDSIDAGAEAKATLEGMKARLDEKWAELQRQVPLYTIIDRLIKSMVPATAAPSAS